MQQLTASVWLDCRQFCRWRRPSPSDVSWTDGKPSSPSCRLCLSTPIWAFSQQVFIHLADMVSFVQHQWTILCLSYLHLLTPEARVQQLFLHIPSGVHVTVSFSSTLFCITISSLCSSSCGRHCCSWDWWSVIVFVFWWHLLCDWQFVIRRRCS